MKDDILLALKACTSSFEGCDAERLSSTVHLRVNVVRWKGDQASSALIQLSDYTRSGLGGQRWRLSDPAKGIIGRCLRAEQKVWVNFRTAQEYRHRMVEEFGYTAEEASRHTTTARSYLAYPLTDEDELVGVLYFFSTEPQVFPLAADDGRLREAADRITGLLRVAEVL
jgi:GAF domain-containing protein